jgi:hypothetical protein
MKYLRLYEEIDDFYKGKMWFVELRVNGHEGFNENDVIERGEKLVEIFEKNNIVFRMFWYDDKFNRSLSFFSNKKIPEKILPDITPGREMIVEIAKLHQLPENFKDMRINDIDLFFATKKYNL